MLILFETVGLGTTEVARQIVNDYGFVVSVEEIRILVPRGSNPQHLTIWESHICGSLFLFVLEFHRTLKTKRPVDVPHLIDAHRVKFAERIFINLIRRSDSVSEFPKFNCDLKKISVDPLLRSVYYRLHRGSYSRREVIHVLLLLEIADIEIYRLLDELAPRRAVILGEAVIHFFHCLGIKPQRELYFVREPLRIFLNRRIFRSPQPRIFGFCHFTTPFFFFQKCLCGGLCPTLYRLGDAELLTCIKIIPPNHPRSAHRAVLRTPRKPPQIGSRTARR